MKKKLTLAVLIVVCIFTFFINIILATDMSEKLTPSLASSLAASQELGNEFNKISTYLVRYNETDEKVAADYADIFNVNDEFYEYDDYYLFKRRNESLLVYKYVSLVSFRQETKRKSEEVPVEKAVENAVSFVQNKLIPFTYDEVKTNVIDDIYNITFIKKLGGIKLHDFNSFAKVDLYGNVLQLDLYYCDFSKYGSCGVMPIEMAFAEAGLVPEEVNEADNKGLVYVYESSVILPAYLLEGVDSHGKEYQTFINAAKFN